MTTFLSKSNGKLNSMFDTIPDFLKSLISTLPFPLAKKLDKKSAKDVTTDILKDLMKPGVITGVLKNIMSVLRTRFPAFVGSNALYLPPLFTVWGLTTDCHWGCLCYFLEFGIVINGEGRNESNLESRNRMSWSREHSQRMGIRLIMEIVRSR
jgi:hypothetical protein